MTKFAQFLRRRRTLGGLTQGQLATQLGVSVNTVSRWERGRDLPSERNASAVSKFLQVSKPDLQELLGQPDRPVAGSEPGLAERVAALESRVDAIGGSLTRLFDHVVANDELVVLQSGNRRIELRADGAITISDGSATLKVDSGGLDLEAASEVRMSGSGSLVVTFAAVEANAATLNAYGALNCTTLTANSVVSDSYTPGAGNIW